MTWLAFACGLAIGTVVVAPCALLAIGALVQRFAGVDERGDR